MAKTTSEENCILNPTKKTAAFGKGSTKVVQDAGKKEPRLWNQEEKDKEKGKLRTAPVVSWTW